jgi:hypothetical protein
MKKLIFPFAALMLFASCSDNATELSASVYESCNSEEDYSSYSECYYSDEDDDEYEDEYEDEDEDLYYGSSSTISDSYGNYYYANTDGYGNTTCHDLNGNYYYSHTDEYGNTSGYDLNGNFYYAHTDDNGNTSGYDLNGNYYGSITFRVGSLVANHP